MRFINVVFPLAHPHPLTYYCRFQVEVGCRVKAPLKGKERVGFVVGLCESPPEGIDYKEAQPIDETPIVPENIVKLINWVARYYLEPLGVVWAAALPPSIRRGKEVSDSGGILVAKVLENKSTSKLTPKQSSLLNLLKEKGPLPVSEIERVWGFSRSILKALEKKGLITLEKIRTKEELEPILESIVLSSEQQEAVRTIQKSLNKFGVYLIHGVTASGKTEIYRRLSAEVVERGGSALILVPEIALTPHYIKRFEGMFGDKFAVIHSGLSDTERARTWMGIREGRYKVVVGTRSAVFAPFQRCSLIVVDEEHDASYKQQESPRYNARDVAVVRGTFDGCPVVLGSATPSVESYHNALKGKYHLITLKKRVTGKLPKVCVVDMRQEKGIFSRLLLQEIERRLLKKEITVLLLNRRGYSRILMCKRCGKAVKCPNCDVSLTSYKTSTGFTYRCNWCGYESCEIVRCSECGSGYLTLRGYGIQQIEEKLKALFPEASVRRMDRDTVKDRFSRWKVIEEMERGKVDILVGTQMVSKGHHFPKVTLVGILLADMGINIPDFRAGERTFQLICQTAGRAGRADDEGLVIVQTFNPDHYAIRLGAQCNCEKFYQHELELRKELKYPPYSHLVRILCVGTNRERVKDAAERVKEMAEAEDVKVFGPASAPIERIKNRYRFHIILSSNKRKSLLEIAAKVPLAIGSVRIFKDVDPYEFL